MALYRSQATYSITEMDALPLIKHLLTERVLATTEVSSTLVPGTTGELSRVTDFG